MNRRTVLTGAGITLSLVFSGCLDSEGDETPESQDQTDDSVGDEETNENGDSTIEESDENGDSTSEETDDEKPKDDEPEPGPGGPMIQVTLQVTDDHADHITPLSSSDERIADVQLFSDLFSEIEDAAQTKSGNGIIGESFTVQADRETDEGREAMDAREQLPLMEETMEQWEWGTEEGVYVKHNGHIIFMFFRIFHQD